MIKKRVFEAYDFAKKAHNGQMRKFSNKEYFVHCKYVARIIEDLTKDEDLVIAALLHDVIEDTNSSIYDLRIKFGDKVTNIVCELTSYIEENQCKTKYLSDKISKMSTDALTIKLADRWHNVMFLDKDCKTHQQLSFLKKYVKETVAIIDYLLPKRELNDVCRVLVRKISDECDYLKIKFLF